MTLREAIRKFDAVVEAEVDWRLGDDSPSDGPLSQLDDASLAQIADMFEAIKVAAELELDGDR